MEEEDKEKVATQKPVESWLTLEQQEIKQLSSRTDALGKLAAETFSDRQSVPHPDNYKLRSAFADLLSHPDKIEQSLSKYNNAIQTLEQLNCQK